MDLSSPPSPTTNPLLTPVFGDNVQDLLNAGALNVNPSAIITVNSTNDAVDDLNSGVTTLRDAINQANGDTGEDLIVFERSLFSNQQTITLSGTELDITHNLDIIAPRDPLTGGDLVTVSGNKASRVFEIESGATVTLSGLIVADGNVRNDDDGGGIKNCGVLTLDSSIVRNDFARSGGGIANESGAMLMVSNSTINRNLVDFFGGGITSTGTLTVSNSTISDNTASDGGGGGGISNTGTLTVSNSTLSGNSAVKNGGGIFNGKSEVGNGGTVNVSNTTLSGNTAGNDGGGIFNDKTLTLVSSTLTLNSASLGGGMFNDALGNACTRNTIIAANLNSPNGINPDVSGTFNSNGYNLIGDSTGSTGFDEAIGDIVGTSDNPIDPRLDVLAFNGGPTQTIALLPDSPAIDAGDPTVLDTDPTTDQRGLARVVNGRADIGAFEVQV